jgi:hypothetical protein
MTLAIHTRYQGPTDTKGARISATCTRVNRTCKIYVGVDHALDGVTRHAVAAREMITRHFPHTAEWSDPRMYYAGETLDGKGYVFTVCPTVED